MPSSNLPLLTMHIVSIFSFSMVPLMILACPINFGYMRNITWYDSTCFNASSIVSNESKCCHTIKSLFSLGLARHLNVSSMFLLPDNHTSVSCLKDFQVELGSLEVPTHWVSTCLDPEYFVSSPSFCDRIESLDDWFRIVGKKTSINYYCKDNLNLSDYHCRNCLTAIKLIHQNGLMLIDHSKGESCLLLTQLYAAGSVNVHGPESKDVASCIFQLNGPIVNVHYHSFLTKHKYVCRYVILPSALLLVLGAWISFRDWVIRKCKIM